MKKKKPETAKDPHWHLVYLGVGSNLGDRINNIRAAADFINNTDHSRVVRISKIYETKPWGYQDQDDFLNCVFEARTLLPPDNLIHFLLDVETRLKRERKILLGPRTIDLDILFYDKLVSTSEHLVIPHPRLHERRFVLIPLCDLVPAHVHPVINMECRFLAETLKTDEEVPKEYKEQISIP